jgi:hypothetical protein
MLLIFCKCVRRKDKENNKEVTGKMMRKKRERELRR